MPLLCLIDALVDCGLMILIVTFVYLITHSYCGPVDDLEAHVLTCAGKVEITEDDLALPQSQCAACGLMLTADGIILQAHMSIHSDYKCKK